MIVLDASAMVEMLLRTPKGALIRQRMGSASGGIHAPHLIDVEVAHVLRRMVRTQAISVARASMALEILRDLDVTRYPSRNFLRRIWDLRDNFSAYDAAYVALAETLKAMLFTCDGRLNSAPGHNARIQVF